MATCAMGLLRRSACEFREFGMATVADLPQMDQGLGACWAAMSKRTSPAGQYLFTTLSKVTKLYLGIGDSV